MAQGLDSDVGGHGYGEGALLMSLEAANITLAVVATMLFASVARRLGTSREGIAIGYLMTGIALLGITRVFYIVADRGVISVHDDTLELWWHLIFYLSMVMFICGGKALSSVPAERVGLESFRLLRRWQVISVALTAAVFLSAEALDQPFVSAFDGTLWDRLGVQHFVALVLAALAALQMTATSGGGAGIVDHDIVPSIRIPLVVTLSLFSLDHLWELLAETWELFIAPETLIERTEQLIVFPAIMAATYAGWRLRARTDHRPPPPMGAVDFELGRQERHV